jgi:prevent-host-death family protein
MQTIGAHEAKAHFSSLLDRVSKGETITITRHGIPVAILGPIAAPEAKLSHRAIVLRKRIKPGGMSVRQMVEEGRRFASPPDSVAGRTA